MIINNTNGITIDLSNQYLNNGEIFYLDENVLNKKNKPVILKADKQNKIKA